MSKLILLCVLILCLVGCNNRPKYPEDTTFSGKELMNNYCVSCHSLPNPNSLDKNTWRSHVLPRMGYMLGFRNQPDSVIFAFTDYGKGKEIGETSPYLANKAPILSPNDWIRLQEFILNLAPDSLLGNQQKITQKTNLFKVKKVEMPFPRTATTMTTFVSPDELLVADANRGLLMHFNNEMKVVKWDSLGPNILQVKKIDNTYWLTHMGDYSFQATDDPQGFISCYSEEGKKIKLIENLSRPVDLAFGDLTGDANMELVISEFGKWTGNLSMWQKVGDDYERNNLINLPGAIKSEIYDLNDDKKNDIVCLFAQADEAIYVLYNQGNGEFLSEKVLSFPPTYGSTYFTLEDYNKDGFKDIIYTAGDNGDYSSTPKPYHGIRVFFNNGKNQFEEKIFIPLHGAYKVLLEDFDLDGDSDFACISYFPRYDTEYFVFLENDGKDHFTRKLLSNNIKGQWLTMDKEDFDDDGDIDLVLGAYDWGQSRESRGYVVPLVYLENKTINKDL